MLSLGTAQFGFDYGICNNRGIVKKVEVLKILKFCKFHQILSIDTAQSYGKSHNVLSKTDLRKFKITSKLSPIKKKKIKNLETYIIFQVDKILADLGVKKIHSLLIHDASQLEGQFGKHLYKILYKLKNKKFIKLGVSVYTKRELENIIDNYKIDIVNMPISVANQSFVKGNYLSKIKKKKIEIQARSVFLQGLLLCKINDLPSKFKKNKFFCEWNKWLEFHNYDALDVCLGYLKNLKQVSKIIVGVNELKQLKDILKAFKKNKKFKFMKFTQSSILRKPSKW